jgi:hypothetical protein
MFEAETENINQQQLHILTLFLLLQATLIGFSSPL